MLRLPALLGEAGNGVAERDKQDRRKPGMVAGKGKGEPRRTAPSTREKGVGTEGRHGGAAG